MNQCWPSLPTHICDTKGRWVKTCDAKIWQREFLVRVCASNMLLISIFLDVIVRIESRCVIKAKPVLLVCEFVRFFTGKPALPLKRSCKFSREKSNTFIKTGFTTYMKQFSSVQCKGTGWFHIQYVWKLFRRSAGSVYMEHNLSHHCTCRCLGTQSTHWWLHSYTRFY